jgi:RES domain-containing protein
LRLWRIYRRTHGPSVDGTGGFFAGGRWSKRGHRVVYFSDTPSLAVLEKLVHLDPDFLEDHLLGLFELDQESRGVEDLRSFPPNWIENPTGTAECGSGWLAENTEVLLSVPSVVVPEQRNFLLNAAHPEASRLRQVHERSFRFDVRLM